MRTFCVAVEYLHKFTGIVLTQLRHVGIKDWPVGRAQEWNIVSHRATNVFKLYQIAVQRSIDLAHPVEQSVKTFPHEDTFGGSFLSLFKNALGSYPPILTFFPSTRNSNEVQSVMRKALNDWGSLMNMSS
ncbi:MAG: hypothetical protein QOD75_2722 [Blastocatellia bacterium]|nr:hypothetical protein [Blastocatellia bacterium]